MHFKKMIIIQSFNKVFYVYPLLQVSCVNNANILSFKSLWGKKNIYRVYHTNIYNIHKTNLKFIFTRQPLYFKDN